MKKWNMMMLVLALLALPATGMAQDLPDFLSAVYTGIGEGLEQGAMQAMAAMDQELTLELIPESGRIEEGQTVCLTVKAGNPRPQPEEVNIVLDLPERLTVTPDTAWTATLPAAEMHPETGELVPSQTLFTREITLVPGGESMQAEITAEMSMGTRFYRTKAPVALCVPDIKAEASVMDVSENRVQPGDAFAYQVSITNAGTASKDVTVELTLPEGVAAADPLPAGFTQEKNAVRGRVRAEAAGDTPGMAELCFPVTVAENVLEGEADARKLLSGALLVDGERVALPRVEVCGSKISAALMTDKENLEAGETAKLSMVVVNSGLAAADVKLSCVLPTGLTLHDEEEDEQSKAVVPPDEGGTAAGAKIPAVIAQEVSRTLENRTLVFDLHMEAARETDSGVIANTQVLEIPVIAEAPQDQLSEALLGTTMAWSVDDMPVQLGDAVAMRVVRDEFLGISKSEWNGIFWAGVLLLAAVACLYAAARRDSRTEDFCCE